MKWALIGQHTGWTTRTVPPTGWCISGVASGRWPGISTRAGEVGERAGLGVRSRSGINRCRAVMYSLCKRRISCSAKVSFTLLCTSTHSAGKSAAALKTLKYLEDPRTIQPHSLDEASVAPVSLSEWCVASYHDAPFIQWRTMPRSYSGALPAMCKIRLIGPGLSGPRSWLILLYPSCGETSQCVCTYDTCTDWRVERQRTCLCTSRPSARGPRRKTTLL